MILIPLNIVGMLLISYLENPLMESPLRYFICANSVTFALYELEMTPFGLITLAIVGNVVGLLALVLETFGVSKNIMSIIYESISVFAAIALISIFSSVVVDFIAF